ncbi:MAG: hypothetical protein JOZ78_13170 [Chroococcidiopsidaceae cyanobacterium CP_BM_ER_R8_30]|nr:hypothetical protein [Chroococcidiopsidaceae cyanobacterium CP_BM_ER_R8_30]
MINVKQQLLSSKINAGVQEAIAKALERHRRLGESIAVWRDGKVVVLSAEQIPRMENEEELGKVNIKQ